MLSKFKNTLSSQTKLEIGKKLRTASLNLKFTGSLKKKYNAYNATISETAKLDKL